MADTFESLLQSLKDATGTSLKKNKDTTAVKLLNRTVKSLENVLAMFDKFLKEKNIDVGKEYKKVKEKGSNLVKDAKDVFKESKDKGLVKSVMDRATSIKSKLGDVFSKDKEKQNGPPEKENSDKENTEESEEDSEEKDSKKKESKGSSIKKKVKEKLTKTGSALSSIKDKIKEKLSPEKAPLEEKKSWLERLNSRQDKRKKEVEEEKKAVREKSKPVKKGSNWLGKILSSMVSLGGMVIGGLSKSIKFLGGFLFKGFSKAIFRLIPGLSGGIAKTIQSLAGKGLMAAGRGALSLAGTAARAALPFAGQALGMAARGVAMLASGPVGWAVAIGTAVYAGYKLYKYLTRNDVADDVYGKLTRLRLLMYGINDTNKEYYSKIFDLEMVMKDFIKFSNYKVEINKLDAKAIDKILDIFGVTREEKAKYTILNTWFMKRFIPAYKAFVQALYTVNSSIYLDDLDKLKPADMINFISKFSIPTAIYNVTQAPTGDQPEILVKKEDVDIMYTNICNLVKAKAPVEKTAEEKAKEEVKDKQNKNPVNQVTTAPKEPPKPVVETPKTKDDGKMNSPDAEGEDKPTTNDSLNKTAQQASDKLNKASGQLTPGSLSLEGITTKIDKSKITSLDPNVRELFTGMAKEYNALTGKNIQVNEAFRSYADQAALYKSMPDKAAKPGNSTHEYGLAIDVSKTQTEELDKIGLLRKYGFTASVGGENWHLEPIGVSLNPTAAKNDINFRNKAVLASPGKGGGGYGFLKNSIMKKRDTNYQLSIYNSNSDNPIDVDKVAEATSKGKDPSPAGAVMNGSSNKPGTDVGGSKPLNTTGQTPTATGNTSQSPLTAGVNVSSKINPTATTDGEGEAKPSMPSTTAPLASKGSNPSLDKGATNTANPSNQNLDIGKYAELPVEQAIKQAAKMAGMDENVMLGFAKIESGLKSGAKAKTSSASGLFQITGPTWDGLVKANGAKFNLPPNPDKNNPFYNSLMASVYAKENLSRLKGYKEAKVEETTALYLAHHFGLSGANKILAQINSNPNTPMAQTVSPDAYNANYSELNNQTAGSYIVKVSNKLAAATGQPSKVGDTIASKSNTPTATPNAATSSSSPVTTASSSPANNSVPNSGTKQPTMSPVTNYSTGTQVADSGNTSSPVSKQNAMFSPKPSMSSTMYNMSTTSPTQAKDTSQQNPYKDMFNTSKMESIMADQLGKLGEIASILGSIDGKIDIDKIKGSIAPSQAPARPMNVNREVSPYAVDLTRKKIT